jgi:signal transduction histidine kinase/CheY-like chemotaxis protein
LNDLKIMPTFLKTMTARAIKRFVSEEAIQQGGGAYWRELILLAFLGPGVIMGPFVLIPSVFSALTRNLWGTAVIDTIAYILAAWLWLGCRRSYTFKAVFFLATFYVVGVTVTAQVGLISGSGSLWLFFLATMTGLLLGVGPTIVAATLSSLAFAVLVFMDYSGMLSPVHRYFTQPTLAIAVTANFIMLNLISALSVAIMVRGLDTMHLRATETMNERKRAEEEKEKLQVQLQQSQKMEAVGTLAGGIAHDFNNILGAILGYTELTLTDDNLIPESRDNLSEVLSAGKRAKELVKQILMFSRKNEDTQTPVQINLVVEEAAKLLRQTIPTTIGLNMDIDHHTGTVLADATQMHQIVMNLGTNAYHAMREAGGQLEIVLEPIYVNQTIASKFPNLREGKFALLTIKDTGSGMDPVTISRIFDPFFTTKIVGEGTGMGLSVVYGIIQNHGGAIGVESTPGSGTTFKVFLPLIQGGATAITAAEDNPQTGSEHILVVDDEPSLRKMLKKILESLGYRVTAVTSPVEALETFKADPEAFDLMLSDQTMPKMTGDQLAREMMKVRPGFPVVICTGYSDILDDEKAAAMGVRALLMKPLDRYKLSETIRRVLGESVQ